MFLLEVSFMIYTTRINPGFPCTLWWTTHKQNVHYKLPGHLCKHRVKNDRKSCENLSLLSCEWGHSAENGSGKFKVESMHVTMNFLALNFLVYKIKNCVGFSNIFCHSLPCFYTYFENSDSHLLPQGVNKTSGKILDSPIGLIFFL